VEFDGLGEQCDGVVWHKTLSFDGTLLC
jgi:hypothetical protein